MEKHTASKIYKVLCGMAVMLALVAGIASVPTLAASNGIYIATATPHYKHPTTGKIEDAGGEGSAVLGQSMTESATYKKALVEIDAAGNTYITVRLQLMDNIQNPRFQVDGTSVSASLMQEDYTVNTADYRMKVNSENSVIRCNMYVVPMGREVIFYITVSNLQSGSDDFITSVKVEQPTNQQTQTQEQQSTNQQTQGQQSVNQQTQTQGQQPANQQTQMQVQTPVNQQTSAGIATSVEGQSDMQEGTFITEQPTSASPSETGNEDFQIPDNESSVPSGASIGTSSSVETETSKKDAKTDHGLQEFDKEGNKVNGSATKDEKKTDSGSAVIWWILGGVIVVAAAGGCVWYFRFFKKKK